MIKYHFRSVVIVAILIVLHLHLGAQTFTKPYFGVSVQKGLFSIKSELKSKGGQPVSGSFTIGEKIALNDVYYGIVSYGFTFYNVPTGMSALGNTLYFNQYSLYRHDIALNLGRRIHEKASFFIDIDLGIGCQIFSDYRANENQALDREVVRNTAPSLSIYEAEETVVYEKDNLPNLMGAGVVANIKFGYKHFHISPTFYLGGVPVYESLTALHSKADDTYQWFHVKSKGTFLGIQLGYQL